MKKLLFLTTIIFLAAALSCSSNDPAEGKVELSSGSDDISLTGTESKKVGFTSSADWSVRIEAQVKSVPQWIRVEPMSGKAGKASISVSMTETNNTGLDRQAVISIRADSGTPVLITVTQKSEPIVPKLITSIQLEDTSEDEPNSTVKLVYHPSGDGRLIKFDRFNIAYLSSKLEVSAGYDTGTGSCHKINFVYTLTGNKATSYTGSETTIYDPVSYTDEIKWDYIYTENRLSRLVQTVPDNSRQIFTWQDGNITKIEMPQGVEYPMDFTYGNELNNMNLNLTTIIYSILIDDFDFADLLGLRGDRTKYLPSKISNSMGSVNITYTRDAQGYITLMDMDDGEHIIKLTFTYE